MKVASILNNSLSVVTKNMHQTRKKALFSCVESILNGADTTVTSIGRGINSKAFEKHNIKRADRLLSNKKLSTDSFEMYKAFAKTLIPAHSKPVILVDWSDLDPYKQNFLIRASLAIGGRGITLYQEVHDISSKEKRQTHRAFLHKLKQIIETPCTPIIVTDAGFKVPWFKSVLAQGWDFVGRVRLPNYYSLDHRDWHNITTLYQKANTTPKTLCGYITKSNPLPVNLTIFKEKAKGRKSLNLKGEPRKSKKSLKYAKGSDDPWLLATSLSMSNNLGARLVSIYRKRMQIEEGFRDMKSRRYGLGMELHKSYKTNRLANLILLTTLANWVLYLVGTVAVHTNQYRRYQASSVKWKMVLSIVFIGLRAVVDKQFKLSSRQLSIALKIIKNEIHQLSWEGG